ncbi:MAG: beta-N-acetylhexosaminidase [Bacteroidales bacterium]|nr:beta-N-acetylhexosaminidase [Bacteroidales bacterium]
MPRKLLTALAALLIVNISLSAVSDPSRIIPAPVGYSVSGAIYTLRPDGSDIRVVFGDKEFEASVSDLEKFAREEAYEVIIGKKGVTIKALTEKGAFRGRQTVEMLRLIDDDVKHCRIFDYPRFRHRGIMIDESRSFKGKDFILKQIDALALLRMNVMHLHLTDAAGWRLQIDAYPALTGHVAWRKGETYHEWEGMGYPFSNAEDPEAYGGFYTKDDIREIVAYAAERYIDIIPEIEMPGHSMEVNRAYPEISCVGKDGKPRPFSWDLCVGNDGTLKFLETVLEEVIELFPYEYIHIGGDEAVKKDWGECVNCRRRMEEEGMKDVHELQGYLVRHIEKFLRERGRTVIGWDEIVDTGLPEQATVMSWRGTPGGIKAASMGHDVIMSPNTYVYLDYYQDLIRKEPKAVGHMQSLRHVYGYDPLEGIDSEYHHHILGLQGNLWCELIPYPAHAEYMLYPRAFAIAEIGWTPQENREFFGFRERCLQLIQVFRSLGYSTFDLFNESLKAQTGRLSFNDPAFRL